MYFAARGQRKCLSDTQACKWTTRTDFSATAGFGFRSNSRKNGTGRHTDLTEYMRPSASVTLVPCSQPQLRWLASISPPIPSPHPLHPPSPWLECQTSGQSEPAEASWSWGFSPHVNLNAQWTTRSQILKGNEGFVRFVELHVLMFFFIIIYWALQKLRGQ